MTFDSVWRYESGGYDHQRSSFNALPQTIGRLALAGLALMCAWTVFINLAGSNSGPIDVSGTRPDPVNVSVTRGDKLVAAKPRPATGPNAVVARVANSSDRVSLFDPRYTLGHPTGAFTGSVFAGRFAEAFVAAVVADNASAQAQDQVATRAMAPSAVRQAQNEPSSPPSAAAAAPQLQTSPTRTVVQRVRAAAERVAVDVPTIFEKLFGKPSGPALAYASAEDGVSGSGIHPIANDGQTAVYDISARTVYLPDGTRLEAHSGYGNMLDDPRYAAIRDRGVTPPNVYDLELREAPFHGVQALRLIPEDDAKVFGRSGLLAHSFMLGPNGNSNGCVSFRNYDAFLQAYMNHEIKRLVVVAGQG